MKYFISIVSIFLLTFFAFSGTLEDIRNKLKVNNKRQSNSIDKSKNKFEISSMRPGNVQGWATDTKQGHEKLFGMEVTFKINEKGDSIDVPVRNCYFFDKDRNLIDKKNASLLLGQGRLRGERTEAGLSVQGKESIRIVFCYPSSYKFKYAVCVIGDSEGVSVMCYPKSLSYEEFDFDERNLVYAK